MASISSDFNPLSTIANHFTIEKVDMVSKEKWESIEKFKQNFLQNDSEDPANCPYLSQDIANSWLRSRKRGTNPYIDEVFTVPDNDTQFILESNRSLIQATSSLIKIFKGLIHFSGDVICLFDKSGSILYLEGQVPIFSKQKKIEGIIMDEYTMGTNAHELSIVNKRPVQLVGPEHYCVAFQSNIASAVPILNRDEEPLGSLVLLSRPWNNNVWEERFVDICTYATYSLGLVIALGACIEAMLIRDFELHRIQEEQASVSTRGAGNPVLYNFDNIIGSSSGIKKAKTMSKRFSKCEESILLTGESGTGKELFAQAIHNYSRSQGPFVAVNCAAMPQNLIESELFGYEGGSFTGADRNGRPGKIELADQGTLFLDEIGDMPLDLQALLLRILEDKQITRIGGRRSKKVDFRLVAATNKNLWNMVQNNQFREDLYYRLSVLSIQIPSLYQREDDIEILSAYLLEDYCRKRRIKIPRISTKASKVIKEYDWPGNVRQLKNAMIFAANMATNGQIDLEHLPANIVHSSKAVMLNDSNSRPKPEKSIEEVLTLRDYEKMAIEKALRRTNNRIIQAADLLGVGRSTLYRKLKEYGIDAEDHDMD